MYSREIRSNDRPRGPELHIGNHDRVLGLVSGDIDHRLPLIAVELGLADLILHPDIPFHSLGGGNRPRVVLVRPGSEHELHGLAQVQYRHIVRGRIRHRILRHLETQQTYLRQIHRIRHLYADRAGSTVYDGPADLTRDLECGNLAQTPGIRYVILDTSSHRCCQQQEKHHPV